MPFLRFSQAQWRVNQIYWLCVAFLGIWVMLRATGITGPPLASPRAFVLVLLLAAASLALRTLSAIRPGHQHRGNFFTVVDLITIAAGIRLSGGDQSPLWIVLFVAILSETILSPAREARWVVWATGFALLAGTWPAQSPQINYFFDMVTRLFFLTIVSIITRRIRENASAKDAELANLRAELASASERSRLAREIHDGVGNALAASVLRLEVAARVLDKRPQEAGATLKEEAQALRQSMDAVRDWTFFTHPWTTADNGLPPGRLLENEVQRFSQRTGLPVTVTGAAALDSLPAPSQFAILRITQEALTNAAKYAHATQAEVTLQRDGRFVQLCVLDNGQGFSPEQITAGMGLTSMRERAESLEGTFAIVSAAEGGVTITVRLPA